MRKPIASLFIWSYISFSAEAQLAPAITAHDLASNRGVRSPAFVATPVNPTICPGSSITLSVNNIVSNPISFSSDDRWSGVINLEFPFTFYGHTYTQCIVGSNGQLSFNISNANTTESWSPPFPPSALKNTINAPWDVLYLSYFGTVRYGYTGFAPNRIFIIEYCNVAYSFCYPSPSFTGQIQLYEGSNRIETHIYNKPCLSCANWYNNGANAMHGVQNASGTVSSFVPGRDPGSSCWTANNEGKRWTWNNTTSNYDISNVSFSPIALINNSNVFWYNSNNTFIGSGASITVSPSVTSVYRAKIQQSWCQGSVVYAAIDTVYVTASLPAPTANSLTVCSGASTTLYASSGVNSIWYNSSNVQVDTGVFTTPPLFSNTSYTVEYSSGACVSPRCTVNVSVSATLAAPVATSTTVCNSSAVSTLSADCNGNCEWYSDTALAPFAQGSPVTSIPPTSTYYVAKFVNGCHSSFTTTTVPVGNLSVNISPSYFPTCPSSSVPISTAYFGAYSSNITQSNTTSSSATAQQTTANWCTSSDPSNTATCPTTAWRSRTITTPANVASPLTSASIAGVYFWLADNGRTSNYDTSNWNVSPITWPKAVGCDPRVWLKSPQGTYLLLVGVRPLNSDYASSQGNYCYCPTFTPAGTDGVIPYLDGPYNGRNYFPDGGALDQAFVGEDPYVNGGVWTLYVSDVVSAGGIHGPLPASGIRIRNFSIKFKTYPNPTYSWYLTSSSGVCNPLSSSTIPNPVFTPDLSFNNYHCQYTVVVTSGTCTGTSSFDAWCWWLRPDESSDSPSKKQGIGISPNPTTNISELSYQSVINEKVTLRVCDYSGKAILQRELNSVVGENKYEVDLSGHAEGIYFLSLTTPQKIYKARLALISR